MAEQIPLYMADSGKFQKMLPTDTLPASMVTWSNPSIGVFADTAPTITDNGNGTVTVGATVVALATATTVGATIAKFPVAGATFTIPADSQTYYICAKYSANTASYYLEVLEGNINARTITPVYACWNILGVISSQYFGTNGDILANKIDYAQIDTVPYRRSIAGGLIISETSLVWSTTAATIYAGTTPIALSAMTASTSNLVKAYHVAGVWTYSVGTATYDALNYDNGTALVAMGTNKYAVRWIFRSVSNPAQLIYVCGTAYYSTYDAAAAELMRTDLPELITKHCILVGKAIVQSGASAGVTVSTFDVSFAGGAISSDHNSLGGIYGDSPFYHLSLGAYTQTNNILALTGTGLLKLTAGTPSIDSTSYWSSFNHPTVLYNYGITSSDATLDGRYLQLIGGILTGSLFGVNSYLNANENTHDTAPVLTLTNSIYTLGTTLLLAAGPGSTSEIGFSNIGKPAGNQRWNIGVSNDIFYIGGNPTNSTGNLNPYTFSRSGNLGVYGSVTAASFIGPLSGNASSASKIGTARSIALTGDGSWSVSFDGSANVSGAMTLATLLTAGSAGSATTVPTLTWDAKGRLTAAGSAAISIPHTQISDWAASVSGFQPTLGFTPVQQGGGTSMGGNKVYIGWGTTNNSLRLQVDTTNFGSTWPINITGSCSNANNADTLGGNSPAYYATASSLSNYLPLVGGTLTGSLYGLNEYCNLNGASSTTYYYVGSLGASGNGAYYHLTVTIQGGDWTLAGGLIADFNVYNNSPRAVVSGMGTFRSAFVCYYNSTTTNFDFYYKPTFSNWSAFGISSTILTARTVYKYSSTQLDAGNTTAPSGTLAAISTTNWMDQAVSTTSSPTFARATIGNGIYRAYAGDNPSLGSIYASGVDPKALNYVLAWEPNGNTSYLSGIVASYLCVNGAPVITATSSGASVTGTLTVSGLITVNDGISGNLTGHASLDIPLTGSSAITGALTSSNSSDIGSTSFNWGTVYATSVRSTGTESISSFALSGDVLTLSHSNGDLAWVNTIRGSAGGLVLQNAIISGTFSPEVNRQSSPYTITRADQGKMVISIYPLNLPNLTEQDAGFWCLVNWHAGGGGVKFGPTTSGTAWILRGTYLTTSTSTPFTGVVSWDGYTWYAG